MDAIIMIASIRSRSTDFWIIQTF